MTSFIFIELDTRPPEIEIYAPSYTDSNVANSITVKSDENLSDFQNIYLIDSNNNRHNYTFNKKDDKTLTGSFVFNNVSIGLATIYVELEDDVGNRSKLFSRSISVKKSTSLLTLNIRDSIVNIEENHTKQSTKTKDNGIFIIDNSESVVSNILENKNARNLIIKRGINNE